jgi:hypothetical protein
MHMKIHRDTLQRIAFAALLIVLSMVCYMLDYLIFRNTREILFWLVNGVAFLFVQVLLATVILEHMLRMREKRSMLKKLNMVIGAFFSEVGTPLLAYFRDFDRDTEQIALSLKVDAKWSAEQFERMRGVLSSREYRIDSRRGNLDGLREFIIAKRQFLLALLENPNLLEHEQFTELLWAVFHLADELSHRPTVQNLPARDYEHLSGDIQRAYSLLTREWLSHLEHLKVSYPYLFSLAVRTNPFDPAASVEMK